MTGRDSETQRMMRWFSGIQGSADLWGRGAFGKSDRVSAFSALENAMKRVIPVSEDVPTKASLVWPGSADAGAVPRVGRLDDRTSFCVCYNGAGVAMASLMGGYAVDVVLGDKPDLAMLGPCEVSHIPFYALR